MNEVSLSHRTKSLCIKILKNFDQYTEYWIILLNFTYETISIKIGWSNKDIFYFYSGFLRKFKVTKLKSLLLYYYN